MFSGDFIRATPAASMINDINLVGSLNSTTPVNISPVVGIAFTAPPSGQVHLNYYCDRTMSGGLLLIGVRVRTGSTIGSGVIVDGGEPGDGVNSVTRLVCEAGRHGNGASMVLQSLTPGTIYNVSNYYFVTAGAGTLFSRNISVVPIL